MKSFIISIFQKISWYSSRVINYLLGKSMSIPVNADGSFDAKAISTFYIVCDENGNGLFIIAITAQGTVTESYSPEMYGRIVASGIYCKEITIQEFVHYYHLNEQLLNLRSGMKNKLKM
jgi:hypothetical protein